MSRPLRLLIITPRSPLGHGGVERHVLEVSTRLATRGLDVTVLCADPGRRGSDRAHNGVLIRSVRAWPARSDWCFAPGMWAEMAHEEWDLVHVQSYHTFVAPLAMLRSLSLHIPYCVTFHGGGHSARWRNQVRPAQLWALRPLLSRAARLVALARFELDLYGRALRLPADRFALIPNGTDPGALPDVATDRQDGAVIASIGRLERYKGHARVIEALPHVLKGRPDARVLIVGVGPQESHLRAVAAELGVSAQVRFTDAPPGDRAAMSSILAGVSLVVLMSEFETHPLAGLEAAAARRRLLVADRGGLLELAQTGLARAVARDASPTALGDAILDELRKPPPTTEPQLTTWDQCVDSLLALYRSVIAR